MDRQDTNAAVLSHRVGRTLVITLNRPLVRNAIDQSVYDGLSDAFREVDASDEVSVGVVTGAGGTFCSGMDLRSFAQDGPPGGVGGIEALLLAPCRKPLVAAVEGFAVAAGLELALACDVIVASQSARFGLPEVTRGLIAGAGGVLRMTQRMPYGLAMRYALTGELFDAESALAGGLVAEVCDEGTLDTAIDIAAAIGRNAPLAVMGTKAIGSLLSQIPSAQAFALQEPYTQRVFSSVDAREGANAFAEKRDPVWVGA